MSRDGLFRLNVVPSQFNDHVSHLMVCCGCKYGQPMRPESMDISTVCSSGRRPADLEYYDSRGMTPIGRRRLKGS